MGQTQPEHVEFGTEPGQAGRTRALPNAEVTELAGLLEHVNSTPAERDDIYQLAEELGLDFNNLLALVEAAELLGFARVETGDLIITPLGETFADASILTRKEIFASRLRRLPFFRWMLRMLEASGERSLRREVLLTAPERDFPPDEAELQLDITSKWGRYAELFGYDDTQRRFFLEDVTVTV